MPASKINLREMQAPLKANYQEEPEKATIVMRVRRAESDLSDPLHCAVVPESADVTWRSGAHPGVGGAGDVPCSADILLGALVACQETTLRMVAAAMGIEIEALEIEVTGTMDLRGTLGLSRDVPIGLANMSAALMSPSRTMAGRSARSGSSRTPRNISWCWIPSAPASPSRAGFQSTPCKSVMTAFL